MSRWRKPAQRGRDALSRGATLNGGQAPDIGSGTVMTTEADRHLGGSYQERREAAYRRIRETTPSTHAWVSSVALVPWLDDTTVPVEFAANVGRLHAELRARIDKERRVAPTSLIRVVERYRELAEDTDLVEYVRHFEAALESPDQPPSLGETNADHTALEPTVTTSPHRNQPAFTDPFVPRNAALRRSQILGQLREKGVDARAAELVAWIRCPWLDAVPITRGFRDAMNGIVTHLPGDVPDAMELQGLLEGLREAAQEHDAVDYVEKIDRLLSSASALRGSSQEEGTATTVDASLASYFTTWAPTSSVRSDPPVEVADLEALRSDTGHLLSDPSEIMQLLAAAAMTHQVDTVLDLFALDLIDVAHKVQLGGRLQRMDVASALPARLLEQYDAGTTISTLFSYITEHVDARITHSLKAHAFAPPHQKATLEQVGKDLGGITRERVRQLVAKGREIIDDPPSGIRRVESHARLFRRTLGEFCSAEEIVGVAERFVCRARPEDRQTAIWLLIERSGYRVDGDYAYTEQAAGRLDVARTTILDGIEYALVSEETIDMALDGVLHGTDRDRFLREDLRLVRFQGHWIKSDSQRSRVIAALELAGKPATKEELGAVVETEPSRVSSILSGVDGIVRADKHRWALEKWIDDPYGGVAGEIVQRIREDGGKTRFRRLITEIPELFGVSERTVRAHVQSDQFVREGDYVRVRQGDDAISTRDPGRLDRAHRTQLGWAYDVEVTNAHLNGYSFNIPNDVAAANGVAPDTSLTVPIEGTDWEASVIWRLSNLKRTVDVGRVREYLEAEGIEPGTVLRVVASPDAVVIARPEDLRATEAPPAEDLDQGPEAGDSDEDLDLHDPLLNFLGSV